MLGRAGRTRVKGSFQIFVNEVISNLPKASTTVGTFGENLEGRRKKEKNYNQPKKRPALTIGK